MEGRIVDYARRMRLTLLSSETDIQKAVTGAMTVHSNQVRERMFGYYDYFASTKSESRQYASHSVY